MKGFIFDWVDDLSMRFPYQRENAGLLMKL